MLKKCTPLWREAHFEVKMYKTHHCRTTFGGSDVEKVHAVVARSTFPSQNVKHTPAPDHFWQLRCRKSARRCGVKMYKTLGVRTTFGGSDVASLQDTPIHYTTLQYTTLHYTTTLHYLPLHFTTLHYTTPNYTTTTTTLHYTPLIYTTLNYTTLHYITLHYTTFHYTTLQYTTLH